MRRYTETCWGNGTTLVELVVAVSMMAVVMACIAPLLVAARMTLDASCNNTDALQNGRILLNHFHRHLSVAASIESVSDSSEVLGHIEFVATDENTYRYDVGDSGYAEYGQVDSQCDLAGTVTQLQFTCYDGNDMSSPITDANEIRLIKIEITIANGSDDCRDKTFQTAVFIEKDPATTIPNFEGWWCLDDATGITAADSSGNGRHGTLENMSGDEWTTGVLDGALEFNGSGDYVDLPIGTLIEDATDCTVALWVNWSVRNDTWDHIFDFGSSTADHMYLVANGYDEYIRFAITDGGWSNEERIETTTSLGGGWHHVAVTIDDVNELHTLYLDGEVVGQNTDATTNPSDMGEATDNWLCRPKWGDSEYFDGMLDDVRFYSRALSAEEIEDLCPVPNRATFADFEEAKIDAAQSLTIPTPGSAGGGGDAVSILGSDSGTSFTIPDGSNRLLVFTAHVEDNDEDMSLDAVTYGGQAMTKIIDEHIKEGRKDRAYVVAYMLNESGIASANGDTFSCTWSSSPDYDAYYNVALENVDQGSPIGESDSVSDDKDEQISTGILSTNIGDLVLVAATAGGKGSYTPENDFIELAELDLEPKADGVVDYWLADTDEIEPKLTHSHRDCQVMIGFVIQHNYASAGGVTTIEGDLLIAAVATDSYETISEPSGEDWTLLSHGNGDGKVTLGVWVKLASASESRSHTFTWGSEEDAYGWIMRFEGFDPSSPLDAIGSQGGGKTSTPPSPSVTTSVANTMILRLGGFDKDKITVDDAGLSGYTTITMDENDGGPGSVSGGAAYQYQVEIGASGTDTFELTDDEQYRTVTIAIAPADQK